ncbi:uncharacterized protein LOC117399058 isoform X2 [Acipenser ruthenus]|uniref:uncharacterized protein LOC117399058 isoform X2 n=1 Tax=Acipenser ruthenus TaxID=7906 RepID=UPI00145A57B5|nr:uncharacterized protein LOC117399058 isoform X2 [Acipenser ruthenus]
MAGSIFFTLLFLLFVFSIRHWKMFSCLPVFLVFVGILGFSGGNFTTRDSLLDAEMSTISEEDSTTLIREQPYNVTQKAQPHTLLLMKRYWILLVTPFCAVIIGALLFTLTLHLQHRRELKYRLQEQKKQERMKIFRSFFAEKTNGNGLDSHSFQHNAVHRDQDDAVSYENVDNGDSNLIPALQEDCNVYMKEEEEDYVIPDDNETEAEGEGEREMAGGEERNALLREQELSYPESQKERDGESYENMESSVYAVPFSCGAPHSTDRVTEQEEEEDGESYENMEGDSATLWTNRETEPEGAGEEDEDSYENMAPSPQVDKSVFQKSESGSVRYENFTRKKLEPLTHRH